MYCNFQTVFRFIINMSVKFKRLHSASSTINIKICRVCLATNVKMVDMNTCNRKIHFKQITGLNIEDSSGFPQALCWECAHRLAACQQFRLRARLTHFLMEDLLKSDGSITEKNVSKINRREHNLETNLVYCSATTYNVGVWPDEDIEPYTNELTAKLLDEEISIKKEDMYEMQPIEVEYLEDEDDFKEDEFDWNVRDDSNTEGDLGDTTQVEEEVKPKNQKKRKVRKDVREKFDENIICEIKLSYEEQLQEVQNRKESNNYRFAAYKCKFCFKGFQDEAAFKLHIFHHSEQKGPYECKICKLRYKSAGDCRSHVAQHHECKYNCKLCPYVGMSRLVTKKHQEYHNGTTYQCPHCEKSFIKMTTCMSHVRIKHPSPYVCNLCGNSFIGEKGLNQHKNLKHRFEKDAVFLEDYPCKVCDINFASQKALDTHNFKNHRDSMPEPEERSRGRRRRRAGEAGVVVLEDFIQCFQCGELLKDPEAFAQHLKREHGATRTQDSELKLEYNICVTCGRLVEDYEQHRCQTGERQRSRTQKRFRTDIGLQEHKRSHPDRDAPFRKSGGIQRHLLIPDVEREEEVQTLE